MVNSSGPLGGKGKLYRIIEVAPEELEGMQLAADDELGDPNPRGHSDHGAHHDHGHGAHHDHDHPTGHTHSHPQ
jgi:hypothetical protein